MAVQIEGRVGPCDAGPLGISTGSASRAMSSTGTSIESFSDLRRPASTMVMARAGIVVASAPANSCAISRTDSLAADSLAAATRAGFLAAAALAVRAARVRAGAAGAGVTPSGLPSRPPR